MSTQVYHKLINKTSVGIIKIRRTKMNNNENSVSYDYKAIKVKREMETITIDTYQSLGWQLTNTSSVESSLFHLNLSFKRNRKITNKTELLKLQSQADNTLNEIENIQNKKRSAGTIASLSVGIIGSLVLGGGMSMVMVLGSTFGMIGGIALGLIGIGICTSAYPIYKKIHRNKNQAFDPMLETQLDKLADISEQANQIVK